MLVDDVIISVKAGDGGDGARTFKHMPDSFKTPPDGGNGGRGGNVYFIGSSNVSDLSEFRFKKKLEAENGERGGKNNLYGAKGEDITIQVPLGTHITNTETGETIEIIDSENPIMFAKGGHAGLGNLALTARKRTNYIGVEKGGPGEEKQLHLVLKFIADVGLIGFPNAGKSSLLASLTNADPKIGDYPFTTLEPNLGVMRSPASGGRGLVLADIPGLIAGASEGKGLGITFLKHIEKTNFLMHLIDATTEDPLKVYKTVRAEFEQYANPELLEKDEVIVLSKIDLVDPEALKKKIAELKKTKKQVLTVSIYDEKSLNSFKDFVKKHIETS